MHITGGKDEDLFQDHRTPNSSLMLAGAALVLLGVYFGALFTPGKKTKADKTIPVMNNR